MLATITIVLLNYTLYDTISSSYLAEVVNIGSVVFEYTLWSPNNLVIIFVTDTYIRLVGGTNRLQGRVEILYQGTWGTICDDGWDDIDTTIVCRELGFSNGTTARQDQFGSSLGPVWISQVSCLGNESKLSHCAHGGAGIIGTCSHSQDVAVQCSPHGNQLK